MPVQRRSSVATVLPVRTRKSRQCRYCNHVASRAFDLPRHERTHLHPEEKIKIMHPCPFPECAYKTLQIANLKVHVRTHTNSKDCKCPDCDYACVDPAVLTRHRQKHHDYVARSRGPRGVQRGLRPVKAPKIKAPKSEDAEMFDGDLDPLTDSEDEGEEDESEDEEDSSYSHKATKPHKSARHPVSTLKSMVAGGRSLGSIDFAAFLNVPSSSNIFADVSRMSFTAPSLYLDSSLGMDLFHTPQQDMSFNYDMFGLTPMPLAPEMDYSEWKWPTPETDPTFLDMLFSEPEANTFTGSSYRPRGGSHFVSFSNAGMGLGHMAPSSRRAHPYMMSVEEREASKENKVRETEQTVLPAFLDLEAPYLLDADFISQFV